MEKSTLLQLVSNFAPVEIRELRKFLESAFFNQRQDIIDLFGIMAENKTELEKTRVWKQLYGKRDYDDQHLRLVMSYLHRLLESYLIYSEVFSDKLETQLQLAKAYRKRGMQEAFERTQKGLAKNLDEQPLRDAQYFKTRFHIEWETFQLEYVSKPTEVDRLYSLSETTDLEYLMHKLRILCLLTAHQSVYPAADFQLDWVESVLAIAAKHDTEDYPAIQVYLRCYRMLSQPDRPEHFQVFKKLLFQSSRYFKTEEMHSLNIWAVNYCIRCINAGETAYYRETLDLYKEGLEKAYIFQEGMLSRFTYHNIVAGGIYTGDLDWVRYFILEYKNRLEKQYRESSFSFNLARLEYACRHYDYVLELLQKANYRDPLLNLSAKTLLLKTYYETGALDLLQSHLDAMRNYIHRKRIIGYHRTNYLNIIKYTEKLMRLNPRDRAASARLLAAVKEEAVLTEKAFFEKVLA